MIRSAIRAPMPADWATLAMEPAADIDTVRRAYRARLKQVSPERDPEAFQQLREAYEVLLASFEPAAPDAGSSDDTSAMVANFIAALNAQRAAGDPAAAIALVDVTLAAHPPGSARLGAIEDALLDSVAVSSTLSPQLFAHLVQRFDWTDTQGRAAQRDPERHAYILDRVASHEWMAELAQRAALPEERVARLLQAPADEVVRQIAAQPLDAAERQAVRDCFDALRSHMHFVLLQFDGATLAALREAVEGPPLLNLEAAAAAQPAAASVPSLPKAPQPAFKVAKVRDWRVTTLALAIVVAVVLGPMLFKSRTPAMPPDDSPSSSQALVILKNANAPWVLIHEEPGGINIDWGPLINLRHGFADARFGVNVDEPNAVLGLPQMKVPMSFMAPPDWTYLTLRVRYLDGTWSEVRRYPIPKKGA